MRVSMTVARGRLDLAMALKCLKSLGMRPRSPWLDGLGSHQLDFGRVDKAH